MNVCYFVTNKPSLFLQPVSNTCKSLIYGLMVIVLALFDEDTLGELQVKTGNVKSLWHIKYFSDVFCHMVLDPFLTECLKKKKTK